MEIVEDVVPITVSAEPVHEAEPLSKAPGSLTKNRRAKHGDVGSADVPDGDWNKFARDFSPKKQPVHISSYSKEEAIRRRLREKERRYDSISHNIEALCCECLEILFSVKDGAGGSTTTVPRTITPGSLAHVGVINEN